MEASDDIFIARVEVAGLTHLLPLYREQLVAAAATADAVRKGFPAALAPECEPAVTLRLMAET